MIVAYQAMVLALSIKRSPNMMLPSDYGMWCMKYVYALLLQLTMWVLWAWEMLGTGYSPLNSPVYQTIHMRHDLGAWRTEDRLLVTYVILPEELLDGKTCAWLATGESQVCQLSTQTATSTSARKHEEHVGQHMHHGKGLASCDPWKMNKSFKVLLEYFYSNHAFPS